MRASPKWGKRDKGVIHDGGYQHVKRAEAPTELRQYHCAFDFLLGAAGGIYPLLPATVADSQLCSC